MDLFCPKIAVLGGGGGYIIMNKEGVAEMAVQSFHIQTMRDHGGGGTVHSGCHPSVEKVRERRNCWCASVPWRWQGQREGHPREAGALKWDRCSLAVARVTRSMC